MGAIRLSRNFQYGEVELGKKGDFLAYLRIRNVDYVRLRVVSHIGNQCILIPRLMGIFVGIHDVMTRYEDFWGNKKSSPPSSGLKSLLIIYHYWSLANDAMHNVAHLKRHFEEIASVRF